MILILIKKMSSTILMTKQWNPESFVIGSVNEKNATFYYPLASGSDEFTKLRVQTPRMRICFDPDEKKTKEGKVFVKNVSFSTQEIGSNGNKKTIRLFKKRIQETDKKIFGLLPEILQNKSFSSSLWQGKNTSYEPTMKVSFPYRDGVCKTQVYDKNDDRIDEEEVKKGVVASAILKLDNMWIWRDKVGINWVVEQLKIYEEQKPFQKFTIRKVDDEEEEET